MARRPKRVRMADLLFAHAPHLYEQCLRLGCVARDTGDPDYRHDVFHHKARVDGDGGTSALVELGLNGLLEVVPDTRRRRPLP